MGNLRDLADRMRAQAGVITESANTVKKNAATQIIDYLARATPVDSGQAISNWQVTLDSPNAHRIEPYVKGKHGSTYEVNVDQTIQQARATIAAARPGQTLWIQNPLPYIRRLNDGYSSQAPAGFVEAAQLIGRKVIEKGLPNVG